MHEHWTGLTTPAAWGFDHARWTEANRPGLIIESALQDQAKAACPTTPGRLLQTRQEGTYESFYQSR